MSANSYLFFKVCGLDIGTHFTQRETLICFIVEKYGRGSMASFLPAIVAGTDWQGIIRDAFGEDPADFERKWQAWLDNR